MEKKEENYEVMENLLSDDGVFHIASSVKALNEESNEKNTIEITEEELGKALSELVREKIFSLLTKEYNEHPKYLKINIPLIVNGLLSVPYQKFSYQK